MITSRALKAASLFAIFSVSACSTPNVEEADRINDETRQQTELMFDTSAQPLPSADVSNMRVSDKVWLGGEARRMRNGRPLPRAVEDEGVTLVSFNDLEIMEIGALVDQTTGIPVSIDDAIINRDVNRSRFPLTMAIDYEGKLSTFLGRVANNFGVNWTFDGDEINFYLHPTRTYAFSLLPSSSQGEMSVSSGGGGDSEGTAGSSGSSSQSLTSSFEIDIWSELVVAIQGIVGDQGQITASRSTGTVSITASNTIQRKVADYIDLQNERLSKQVAVSVQVFNVTMDDSGELSTDFSLAGVESDEFSYAGGDNSLDLPNSLGWEILKPLKGVASVSGVVRMLEQKGDVSVVTTANATTLNNVPTPIQVGNQRYYVSNVQEVIDEDLNETSVDFETSSVQTGFNMQVLPRVMSGGRIALQYNIGTSELVGADDGFDRFAVNGSEVQLPNINNRSFTNQVMIPHGNTLVLSGFEQTTARSEKQGVGSADNWVTGGRNTASLQRDVMVVMITPVILDTGRAIEEVR